MLGNRITEVEKQEDGVESDPFLEWIENNIDDSHSKLNKLFFDMRKSELYSYKRLSMKLQYEVLRIGLAKSIKQING